MENGKEGTRKCGYVRDEKRGESERGERERERGREVEREGKK